MTEDEMVGSITDAMEKPGVLQSIGSQIDMTE